ncbi:hypothetical protein FB451DRAFT_1334898 [Mycena latifolia]|nr:hypothetical protein FB451DRAFT_1334898 [Mycena latifolia]
MSCNTYPHRSCIKVLLTVIKLAKGDYCSPAFDFDLVGAVLRKIRLYQILKKIYGNKILLAPVNWEETDKVLDIGTGPGGFKLSPIENPNIELRVKSVTNLPAEWSDTFSLVHQRLLIYALQIPHWTVALREIYRVLRPGGWVQLGECVGRASKGSAILRSLTNSRNMDMDCTQNIPKLLEDNGFGDIHCEIKMRKVGKWAGDLGVANRINHLGLLQGLKTPILKAGGLGYVASEEEYDRLVDGVEREWDETPTPEIPGVQKEFFIFWARKPAA